MKNLIEPKTSVQAAITVDNKIISSVSEGEFKRIEDKFLVSKDMQDLVFKCLSANMDESYFENDTHYTLIESIYFDSSEITLFKDHFNVLIPKRYKMRVRRYGPNGVWNTENYLLEVKSKKEGQCKKVRFTIGQIELDVISGGLQLQFTERLINLNPKMKVETLQKRVNKINELIQKYGLIPSRSVKYKRFAFEKDGFRATIDVDLQEKSLIELGGINPASLIENEIWNKATNLVSKFKGEDKFVLELKHGGSIPAWAKKMLKEYHIAKTSFSKYCYFTARELKGLHKELQDYISRPLTPSANSSTRQ